MDISAAMAQFYDDKGEIAIPDQLSLSAMCEMLYSMAQMEGAVDTPLITFHDFSGSAEGETVTWTRAEVNTRIKAVCVRLQQVAERCRVILDDPERYHLTLDDLRLSLIHI